MKILVINAGSSSLKFQLMNTATQEVLAKGLCERIGIDGRIKYSPANAEDIERDIAMPKHSDAIRVTLDLLVSKDHGVIESMSEIEAVGHRIVHGGEKFTESVLVTDEVIQGIEEVCPLAPLHNPGSLSGIRACLEVVPGVPQVLVIDTAFHQTMPKKAYLYALPYHYYTEDKIRRYGAHGTSHRYVSARAAKMLGRPLEELKIVTCHLGNGSSISAVKNGKVIDTSMGFTPLAGVPMGTRTGDMDPAVVTYLMEHHDLTPNEMDTLMNKESGMLGVSGVSPDFRDVKKAADAGNERAQVALQMFDYGVTKYIGAYAAAMGGVDAIVFTAGVGENDCERRFQMTAPLGFLGVKVDAEKNQTRGKEIDISAPGATVHTLVIPTNEELVIALDTEEIVSKL